MFQNSCHTLPNNYFQFKQFTIYQDNCAMKVCTDACILGAWTSMRMESSSINNILDIGCGTGLLSLMLAQKINATIDAVEIDKVAITQATENIAGSSWANRINIIHTSIKDFQPVVKYDLIICNPPFYENDLRSGDETKNAAKHDTTLKLDELIFSIKSNLTETGIAVILLPFHRTAYFEKIAVDSSLFIREKLLVKQTGTHNYFRSIILISPVLNNECNTTELIIHDAERNYTEDFKLLLADYYLNL